MRRPPAGALAGVLVVVCLALALSAGYPFTTAESHAETPQSDRFTVGDADAFDASGRIVVDGDVRLSFDGVVTGDGAWYQRVVEPNVTAAAYRARPDGPVYRRLSVAPGERAQRRRAAIREDEARRLHRASRDGDRVVLLVEANATDGGEPVSGTVSVFVRTLYAAGYERAASDSAAVTVYEPRSGWYDGRVDYRLTDASGTVRVDAGTHAVRSANVSWRVTTPAGSYAEYLLAGLTGDQPTTHRTTVEFTPGETALQRPAWVDEMAAG